MKFNFYFIVYFLSAFLLISCTSNAQSRLVPEVEYSRPVHVSDNVKNKRYSRSNSTTQLGVVKPYTPDEDQNVKTPIPYAKVADDYQEKKTTGTVNGVRTENTYKVGAGDTLYSIAFRYGKDYRVLAKNNGIDPPYNITVGQVLQLDTPTALSIQKNNQKPTYYIVQKGDTAVSVAKKNGLTLSQLAKANNLKKPYAINVGKKLSLVDSKGQHFEDMTTPSVVPVAGAKSTQVASSSKTSSKDSSKSRTTTELIAQDIPASVDENAPVQVVSGKTKSVSSVTWMWPTKGRVIKNFSSTNKGIDIAGTRGQNVNAASAGQVVYSGNALRGYGNLIIINHNNQYLSAYAHNEMLLVKEGQKVKRGQVIAKMGSTDASRVMLHFEIRYKGNSVDPKKYLP